MLLTESQRELLHVARRAVLATTRADGRARLVPCTFAIARGSEAVLYTPLDEKPKSIADPRQLGRVRDVIEKPHVSVLVDHWSEDWTELAWLRLHGRATLLEAGQIEHGTAVDLLRARYPQYADQALEHLPVIRIEIESATEWSAQA